MSEADTVPPTVAPTGQQLSPLPEAPPIIYKSPSKKRHKGNIENVTTKGGVEKIFFTILKDSPSSIFLYDNK